MSQSHGALIASSFTEAIDKLSLTVDIVTMHRANDVLGAVASALFPFPGVQVFHDGAPPRSYGLI
jgi:hypothetical protein